MAELTDKQYEDAENFLNNFVNTMQFLANEMITTLETFKRKKLKRKFITSFHKILYCVAKLQIIQKHSAENLKDIYRTFEEEFSQWREMYAEHIPENYVYKSYEHFEPCDNSQFSYASEIITAHNLLDKDDTSKQSTMPDALLKDNSEVQHVIVLQDSQETLDSSIEHQILSIGDTQTTIGDTQTTIVDTQIQIQNPNFNITTETTKKISNEDSVYPNRMVWNIGSVDLSESVSPAVNTENKMKYLKALSVSQINRKLCENLSSHETSKLNNDYISLMDSEEHEIDNALIKLNETHDKATNNDHTKEVNNSTPNELNDVQNNSKKILQHDISKSQILSLDSNTENYSFLVGSQRNEIENALLKLNETHENINVSQNISDVNSLEIKSENASQNSKVNSDVEDETRGNRKAYQNDEQQVSSNTSKEVSNLVDNSEEDGIENAMKNLDESQGSKKAAQNDDQQTKPGVLPRSSEKVCNLFNNSEENDIENAMKNLFEIQENVTQTDDHQIKPEVLSQSSEEVNSLFINSEQNDVESALKDLDESQGNKKAAHNVNQQIEPEISLQTPEEVCSLLNNSEERDLENAMKNLDEVQGNVNQNDDHQIKPEILSQSFKEIDILFINSEQNDVESALKDLDERQGSEKTSHNVDQQIEPEITLQTSEEDCNLLSSEENVIEIQNEKPLQNDKQIESEISSPRLSEAIALHDNSGQNVLENAKENRNNIKNNSDENQVENVLKNVSKENLPPNINQESINSIEKVDLLPKIVTNSKANDDILLNLNDNSSSMDEEKMAKIEAKLLSDIIVLNDSEQINQISDHSSSSSIKDIDDIDELISDIDISDEDLKTKYKEAIRNICNDSASSSFQSEQSSDSELEFDNQVLQSQGSGKILKIKLCDILKLQPTVANDGHKKSALNLQNSDEQFKKECVVKLQRMDFTDMKKDKSSSVATSSDNINKLLNISNLDRKRRRISSSSSNESNTKNPNKKYKKRGKRRRTTSSSSSSTTSSSDSKSAVETSDLDISAISDGDISDWVPEISDMSSNKETENDDDSSDSDQVMKKKRKISNKSTDKTDTSENENTEKLKNEATEENEKRTSDDDWRNDPLLRFSLHDNKGTKRREIIKITDSSDVETNSDDDVIICEESSTLNKVIKNNKKQTDLLGILNRKKNKPLSISSEINSSDESLVAEEITPRKRSRKMMSYQELAEATKKANEEEKERMYRLTQRQSMCSKFSEELEDEPNTLILEFDIKTKKPKIQVHPELFKVLKDHQKKGIKFMWDSCYESVDLIPNNRGSGCVLAHCMGLGKTLQVIALLHALFSYEETQVKKVLILAPVTTIKNWEREFKTWLSKLDKKFSVDSVIGKIAPEIRGRKIKTWFKNGGVFIMSYHLFRVLSTPQVNKTHPTTSAADKTNDNLNVTRNNKVLTFCRNALVNPGPDLIVCDEGHTLKNNKSEISKCISTVKTGRRIMLTGTPMQNNLNEYYCMINLVKPNLLGSAREFANQFVNPITKGQAKDSSASEIRTMKRRAHVLHKKLSGVVQRVEGSILKPYLPSLLHYIIFIKMSNEQVNIYKKFLEIIKSDDASGSRLLSTYQRAKKISMHPICLHIRKTAEQTTEIPVTQLPPPSDSMNDTENRLNDIFKDTTWITSLYSRCDLERVECGTKLIIFFHILNQCEMFGDKLLAFSTSLNILNVVEYFLKKAPIQNIVNSKWEHGLDYVRVDGRTSTELRDQIYENFNDKKNSRLRLLIATTKVTGLGLNLLGANRIVIFDTSWNPADDMQSVYRIYRFGQMKDCFIYTLVSLGAMEEKIYERCVTKQAISCRVVDEQQVDRHYVSKGNTRKEFYTFVDYNELERPAPNVPSDRILATALQKYPQYIFKYHEHDKLLQNQEDEELDEAEREAAWQEFQIEEERLKRIHHPQINHLNPPINGVNVMEKNQQLEPILITPDLPTEASNTVVNFYNNLIQSRYPAPSTVQQPSNFNPSTSIVPPGSSNELAAISRFYNKLYRPNPPKPTTKASAYDRSIPTTSRANISVEPETIISDTTVYPVNNRMEVIQNSNELRTDDTNPFINESRLRVQSVGNITYSNQSGEQSNQLEDAQPVVERSDIVIIED